MNVLINQKSDVLHSLLLCTCIISKFSPRPAKYYRRTCYYYWSQTVHIIRNNVKRHLTTWKTAATDYGLDNPLSLTNSVCLSPFNAVQVVASEIGFFLESTNISNNFQSAYKQLHSTETALLKIQTDVLTAMDSGKVTALTLLDFSAVFDSIFLERLKKWYGFGDFLFSWLKILSFRSISVCQVRLLPFEKWNPSFWCFTRSVLGPLIFTLYTGPLSRVTANQSVPHHLYADDAQLYISFSADNSESSFYRLQQCLISVQDWTTAINPDKTGFFLIGHQRQRIKYLSMFPVTLLGNETHPSKSAKSLGIVFDENFNFRNHINNVCKSSYCHIRDLRRIRKHLNLDQAQCLVSALVSSWLDYCDSLLHGVAVRNMLKLPRARNCLVRVVTRASRFAPSTRLRHSLHWLPISCRIKFKILTLTYKILSSGKPSYLADLIHLATPSRNLRFNKGPLLSDPNCNTKTGTTEFSASVRLLSGTNIPCVFALLNPRLVFGNV